jgi:hypothetical protein
MESADTTSFCAVLEADGPGTGVRKPVQRGYQPPPANGGFPCRYGRCSGIRRYVHTCGHDGHCAILAGFAWPRPSYLRGAGLTKVDRVCLRGRVLFLFRRGKKPVKGP